MKFLQAGITFSFLLYFTSLSAQVPDPALVGYFHNWQDVNAPYIPLDQVDSRYNVVTVAFALPQGGTDYDMQFTPDQTSPATFISQIQTLQAQGRKVLISIGGATSPITLSNNTERDIFISSMGSILTTYGFDGLDIDLEGSSLTVTGGTTISNPTDAPILRLIQAIQSIMSQYQASTGRRLMLTMAPETAFVQGGQSGYGSIWGAYLPLIHALRDSIDMLHVQLYNSGSMYGLGGGIYTQGTADFIISQTEAVIQGFQTNGGFFTGLPANKVAVGLPACNLAAGGGYADTAIVASAIRYLRGQGPRPGSYTLVQPGGYPNLRGMMTWSINWDAVSSCNGLNSFAANYRSLFPLPAPPNAGFSASALNVCTTDSVQFTDQSTGAPSSFAWTFSGGSPASSSSQNPGPVRFANSGTFPVMLIVSNAGGNDTFSLNITATAPPVLSLTTSDDSLCLGESSQIIASTAANYLWNTGSTQDTLNVTPSQSASFSVQAWDLAGCIAEDSLYIHINPLPQVQAVLGFPVFCTTDAPAALPNGNPPGGTWSGTGVNGSQFDPALAGEGTFTLTYLFTDSLGCSASASDSVQVDLCVSANPEISPLKIYPNPFHDSFNVETHTPGKITISNIYGTVVFESVEMQGRREIQIPHLPSGTYFMTFQSGDSCQMLRLIRY